MGEAHRHRRGESLTDAERTIDVKGRPASPEAPAPSRDAPPSAQDFARLFVSEAPRVLRVLRRLGVRDADVEDVAQEVFLVVHRRAAEFRGESSLRTWIYGIAVRSALGHRRRKHVRTSVELSVEPAIDADQPAAVERAQAREVLRGAIARLPEGPREVFVLYELEELSMRDVANALEVPLATAYTRLYAARSALRGMLDQLASEGAWP